MLCYGRGGQDATKGMFQKEKRSLIMHLYNDCVMYPDKVCTAALPKVCFFPLRRILTPGSAGMYVPKLRHLAWIYNKFKR